jgi:hypothetical protein
MAARHTTRMAARLVPWALAIALALVAVTTASADSKHMFWGQGTGLAPDPNALANDLIYHGGSAGDGAIGIQKAPAVYLVYWGTEWASGFTTADTDGKLYASKTLQNYVNSFVAGLGGSAYAGIQTQYCRGIPAGSTSCAGVAGADFITNPKRQLKGTWVDPTPVPADITGWGLAQNVVDDPIAMEAMRASAHFGYDPDATYFILTPPSTISTGEPAYCGYHTQTTSVDGIGNPYRLEYAFIPWQNVDWPGLGQGCGLHNVNAKSNAFGNGIFDSWSIVVGHEYAEAVTDPDNILAVQDGWNDAQTSENGDKCAWTNTQNIALGGHQFAAQPEWSNEAADAGKDGCVFSR